MFSISKNPEESMAEVLAKAEKYINGEEALISKKGSSSTPKKRSGSDKRQGRSPKGQSDRERSPKKDAEWSPKRCGSLRDRLGRPQLERRSRYSPRRFTPLTASVSQVLCELRKKQFLRWPTQEGPSAQHQVRRDSRGTIDVQTASARHVHNIL